MSTLDLGHTTVDLVVTRGGDYTITLDYTDADTIAGYTWTVAIMAATDGAAVATATVSANTTTKLVTCTWTDTQTAALSSSSYVWKVVETNAAGAVTPIVGGRCTVRAQGARGRAAATSTTITVQSGTVTVGVSGTPAVTAGVLDAAGAVLKSTYDAHTVLAATSDNAPAAVTVAEQRIMGRVTGGNISALTAAQALGVLDDAAEQTLYGFLNGVPASTVYQPVLDAMPAAVGDRFVTRFSATAVDMGWPLGGGLYAVARFDASTAAGYVLKGISAKWAVVNVEDDGAGVVETGTWTRLENANAFGGDYRRSTTAGDNLAFTTQADASVVGWRAVKAANGGYTLVAIDGDATRATLLPTAQDEVNAGRLASSALVANGGTLNPTDRLFDGYAASTLWDEATIAADDLEPGVHVLTLTVTAYKRAASSENRTIVAGFFAGAPSTGPAASTDLVAAQGLGATNGSAYEYAVLCRPSGGVSTWVGVQAHGYETAIDHVWRAGLGLVDISSVGDWFAAPVVSLVRTSNLFHPNVGGGATPIAAATTIYEAGRSGLRVASEIDWAQTIIVDRAFLGMFPFDPSLDACRIIGDPTTYTLDDNDDGDHGEIISPAIVAFDSDGHYGFGVAALNHKESTNSSALSATKFTYVNDPAVGTLNKGYFTRVHADANGGTTETVTSASRWLASTVYVAGWAPDTIMFESL